MEDHLAVQHAKVASEIIDTNLKDAVKDKPSDPKNGKVPLTVSFDMGWQKRGQSYNSLSGHAFLIDAHSVKIVAMQVCSKSCLKCSRAIKKGIAEENVPEHKCPKNYDGSSKGMEAAAALERDGEAAVQARGSASPCKRDGSQRQRQHTGIADSLSEK
jgi:hypothetical protein